MTDVTFFNYILHPKLIEYIKDTNIILYIIKNNNSEMYRLIKFEKSFAAHSTLYLFFQNNLFECCSMEQDWGQCHVNSTNVCFNEIQFTA